MKHQTKVIVTAVAERMQFVRYYRKHLPELQIVWDRKKGAWETWNRALETCGDQPTIRLEDDCCLTRSFIDKAEAEIAKRPNDVIHFFSMYRDDQALGSRYLPGRKWSMTQAYYLPGDMGNRLREFSRTWGKHEEFFGGVDIMMREAFVAWGLQYWLCVPSLVQHAHIPSRFKGRTAKRQSRTFVDPELEGYPATL